jgi:hypothetical protein
MFCPESTDKNLGVMEVASMKISDSNQLGATGLGRSKQAEALAGYGAGSAERREKAGGDQVELSGLAGRLSEVLRAESPDLAARLERLSLAVAAGTYRPAAADVGRSMVQEALAAGPREAQ